MSDPFTFPGFRSPNYTQVPDELFDQLLPKLSEAELKVLLYIIRRTFGFKRESDNISLSQMVNGITTKAGRQIDHGAGLSKSGVVKALRGLVAKNILVPTRRTDDTHGNQPTNYRLNIIEQRGDHVSSSATGTDSSSGQRTPPLSTSVHKGDVRRGAQALTTAVHTQDTVRQETVSKNVNVDRNQLGKSTRPRRSPSAVSEQALINHYGFNQRQIDETQALVDLQLDVLGAGDRNHAAYVKRAAEAVRDGTANILRLAIGDLKDTNRRKAIVSLPAYFTRVYDAMHAEALHWKPEPLGTILPTPPAALTDETEDLRTTQRERLLEDIAAKGYPIPHHIRRASISEIASWYDQVERTHPAHQ